MNMKRCNPLLPPRHVCVIGLGNVLMGDDGFGSLAVETFRCEYECAPNVEVLDLGTPGLDLAPYLYGKDLVIVADAVEAENTPGTLRTYREADLLSHQVQLRLTAHDPGLQESLAQLRIVGHAPSELIIVGMVPESCAFGAGISAAVLSKSSVAVHLLAALLRERGVDCRRRHAQLQPNLWWLPGDRSEVVSA